MSAGLCGVHALHVELTAAYGERRIAFCFGRMKLSEMVKLGVSELRN